MQAYHSVTSERSEEGRDAMPAFINHKLASVVYLNAELSEGLASPPLVPITSIFILRHCLPHCLIDIQSNHNVTECLLCLYASSTLTEKLRIKHIIDE